jgi:hypothetical protein
MEVIESAAVVDQPLDWAQEQFGSAELGDVRRTRRAVKLAAEMATHPAGSIPQQTQTWGDTKAAYRLFDRDEVTFEALTQPHWERTRQAASQRPIVLHIHDGSQLDYTGHEHLNGVGVIGDGGGRGLMLHSVLAVDPSAGPNGGPEVLGLTHQRVYRRREVPKGETRTQRKKRQQQARVWSEAVEAMGMPPDEVRWIHVGDREADNYDFFDACRRMGGGFLVRAYQNRRAAMGDEASEASGYLMDLARSLKPLGQKRLYVRRSKNRDPGWVNLEVAAAPVTIFAPWLSGRGAEPVRCWVVRVWEASPPKGQKPIEWVLLCSEPVEDLSAALPVAEWYSYRWLIEEYHKCLKTGCRVEDSQLEKVERLKPLVGMLGIVAVRLLQLKQYARLDPDRPAEECVSRDHVRVVAAYFEEPWEGMTVYRFWRLVARLGGFLARKGDREPGWQTLWRGWRQLDLMTLGANLQADLA